MAVGRLGVSGRPGRIGVGVGRSRAARSQAGCGEAYTHTYIYMHKHMAHTLKADGAEARRGKAELHWAGRGRGREPSRRLQVTLAILIYYTVTHYITLYNVRLNNSITVLHHIVSCICALPGQTKRRGWPRGRNRSFGCAIGGF